MKAVDRKLLERLLTLLGERTSKEWHGLLKTLDVQITTADLVNFRRKLRAEVRGKSADSRNLSKNKRASQAVDVDRSVLLAERATSRLSRQAPDREYGKWLRILSGGPRETSFPERFNNADRAVVSSKKKASPSKRS